MAKTTTRKRPKSSLTPDKLFKAIKDDELAPVYYFYASEKPVRASEKAKKSPFNDYLLDNAMLGIRKNVVDNNTKDFNYSLFIAGDSQLEAAIDVARTYPMMRPKRLVIAKDAHMFKADDWRSAVSYLEDPSPSTVLVLLAEHLPTQNKGGNAAKQAILANATCVRFAPFTKAADVMPYVKHELKKRHLKIERAAEGMLLELIGPDLNELIQAIEKLELYTAGRDTIKTGDVEHCIAQTKVEELWGLQDALADRRLGPALSSLTRLLENSKPEDHIMLLGSLVRMYKDLSGVRQMLDSGLSANQVTTSFPGHPFRVKNLVRQAQRLSMSHLVKIINYLHDLDRAIKSSRVPTTTHFEHFIMRACGAPRKR